jgi:hypothetical protein
MKNLPVTNECPYCSQSLNIVACRCERCQVEVRGDFPSIPLGNLPTAHQRFIEMFVLASGNLKEIATHAGVSYPTVRSRLDKVIAALREEITAQSEATQAIAEGKQKKAGGKEESEAAASPSVAEIIKQI